MPREAPPPPRREDRAPTRRADDDEASAGRSLRSSVAPAQFFELDKRDPMGRVRPYALRQVAAERLVGFGDVVDAVVVFVTDKVL